MSDISIILNKSSCIEQKLYSFSCCQLFTLMLFINSIFSSSL
jgi:hypothetical protein